MAKNFLRTLIATTALSTVAAPAMAQVTSAAPAASSEDEIIVTARREAENLQDVPVSVQVVTGQTIQDLGITSVEDISKLTPGLTLVNAPGASQSITLRGVTWQPGSGTPATPLYFNEAPFDPGITISSMFDVGQIEVLRGPQGTSRGAPSISGAITLTTHKPDLNEFGGFALGLYGSDNHMTLQGAVNFPIIQDVLAVRLATNIEDSEGNGIRSVHSSIDPQFDDRSYRLTALFEPTDTFSLQVMFQQRNTESANFVQVAGTGSPGFPGFPGALPPNAPNFNGPALTVADNASVQDRPSTADQKMELITVNANWQVLGHNLTVNYGRQSNRSARQFNALDTLNIVPGFENYLTVDNVGLPDFETREIRLSSVPDPNRPIDYDIGWFSKESGGTILVSSPAYLTGAFGHPVTAGPGAVSVPNSRYVLENTTTIGIGQSFSSTYANVRVHPDDRNELSVGVALLKDEVPVDLEIRTFAAFNAFANPALPSTAFCPFAVPGAIASPVYTTGVVCEIGLPAGFRNASQHNNDSYDEAIYNVSYSHRFSDSLLGYFTAGSSFRSGLPAINNPGLPADLVTPDGESAESLELGLKSEFDNGLRINASIFQIDYANQLTTFEGVNYFNTVSGRTAQTSIAFYRNIDSQVRGVELEVAANPLENLSLGANLSYAKIESQGGTVPCNAAAPITALNPINFCQSVKGEDLNQQAPFQATINGSYEIPFGSALDGYVRFNANFQGHNPNYGNFRQGTSFRGTDSYWVVDLYAGLTGNDGGWDLGLFAKNVFDEQVELARVRTINAIYTNFAGPPGYDVVRTSRPQEVGVRLSYAFGAR
jgi:iron complex outermembrane recepter protein